MCVFAKYYGRLFLDVCVDLICASQVQYPIKLAIFLYVLIKMDLYKFLYETAWLPFNDIRTQTLDRKTCFRIKVWFSDALWLSRVNCWWIPLISSEVSMREQGQRRLQARKESCQPPLAQDQVHINCKRVSKITFQKYTLSLCFSTSEKEW